MFMYFSLILDQQNFKTKQANKDKDKTKEAFLLN